MALPEAPSKKISTRPHPRTHHVPQSAQRLGVGSGLVQLAVGSGLVQLAVGSGLVQRRIRISPPSPQRPPPPHQAPTPRSPLSTASPSSHHRALTFLSPPLFPSPHHRRFTLPLTTAFPLPHHGCHSERTGPRTHQGPQSAQRFGVGSGVVSRRICISRSRVATPDRSPLSTASPSSDRGRHSERTGAPNVPWAPKTRSDLG